MSDLAAIRTYVRTQTLTETTDFSAAKLNVLINEGIREIAKRFAWPFLEASATITTVADTQSYAMPADWRRTQAITEDDMTNRLDRITFDEASEMYGGNTPTGTPARKFYIYQEKIWLVPIPSEVNAYTHHYLKEITLLTDDTDEPEFASDYHYTPAFWAIARVWEQEEEFGKMDAQEARFDRAVEMMARHYLNRSEDKPQVWGESRRRGYFGSNLPFLADGELAGL